MSEKYHHILSEFISHVNSSVKLYVGVYLDSDLIDECIRCTKRQLAVDLYFHERIIDAVESQPFLLNHLYKLRAAGASIYAVSIFDNNADIICYSDFKSMLEINTTSNSNDYLTNRDASYNSYKSSFNIVDKENPEYRTEPEDIEVTFTVDEAQLIENTATKINWNVRNAEAIEIDGIGRVPASGVSTVTIMNDTIIQIKATNQIQSKVKSLAIVTLKQLHVNYDVQFLNPASKQFVSLKEETNKGVYGVTKGNQLKFIWNADDAESVLITPFGLTAKSGEHVFYSDGTSEINIQTTLQGKTKTKRIIIHEFPMPVFNHELTMVDEKYLHNLALEVKNMQPQAEAFLNKKGRLNYTEFASQMRKNAKAYEKGLMTLYYNNNFSEFYEGHSIPKLNRGVKDRLKQYFKAKPSMLSMIDSMRNYYE